MFPLVKIIYKNNRLGYWLVARYCDVPLCQMVSLDAGLGLRAYECVNCSTVD